MTRPGYAKEAGSISSEPTSIVLRTALAAPERDRWALEALHYADVGCGPGGERCGHFAVAVEIAATVRVEGRHRCVVVGERQSVHLPPSTVVVGVTRRGRRHVGLKPAELVDHVERVRRRSRPGQVGRGAHRAIELAVDVERGAG